MMRLLVSRGANPAANENQCLSTTAINGSIEAMEILQQAGVKLAQAAHLGLTALEYASSCYGQTDDLIEWLKSRGVSMDRVGAAGMTAMHLAATGYSVPNDRYPLLARLGVPVDVGDAKGRTPLHWAAVTGNVGGIKQLLTLGADRQKRDLAGKTPVELAREANKPEATAAFQ